LHNVCSIKAVYTIDSEDTLLLTKYGIIRDPEITGSHLSEFNSMMSRSSERTLGFRRFFPYYQSRSEYFHILNCSLGHHIWNPDFDLLHALRLCMKIIFAVSEPWNERGKTYTQITVPTELLSCQVLAWTPCMPS
jgi:hypothetical protein